MSLTESGDGEPASQEERESAIRIIAELRHPHLLVMRRTEDGRGFDADLAGGRLLSELLEAHRWALPLRISLRILLDAMSGLAAMHAARRDGLPLRFVHGDVTPRHIVVGRDGIARLIPLVKAHWEIEASVPVAQEPTGYAAPEKLLGDDFSQRADVFSIGVLLWEAIMGKPLFGDLSVEDVVTHLVGGKVGRPVLAREDTWSAELSDVVVRALAVDPNDRWENVGIMGADIETIAEGHMAKSYEVATLVTGRDVTRDSLSDDVTTRFSPGSSLTPFANSIPASDGASAPDSRSGGRAGSTEPVLTSAIDAPASRRPMPQRRARMIVTAALAFSASLLAVAGLKSITRTTVSTSTANVLATPAASPAIAAMPEPTLAEPEALPEAVPAPALVVPAEVQPRAAPASSRSVVTTPGAPAQGRASKGNLRPAAVGKAGKPNDPFGLMKPARPKKDDDPFGL